MLHDACCNGFAALQGIVISRWDEALVRVDLVEAGPEIKIIESGGTENVKTGSVTLYVRLIVFVRKIKK